VYLEVDGHRGDLLCVCLVAVAEVAAMGEVQRHDPIVRIQQSGVDLEVGWRSGEGLDINSPFLRIQSVCLEGPLLAQALGHVDVLVAAVVPRPGVPLGVLVGHD